MVKKMKLKFLFLSFILLFLVNTSFARSLTVNDIKSRQTVSCGTSSDYQFLAYKKDGHIQGFDADICRAIATAVFNDPENFKLVYVKRKEIGKALRSGKIDIMLGHTSLSSTEELYQNVTPVDILYYDKQVFVSRFATSATSMKEFAQKNVCVLKNSNASIFLNEYNNKHALGFNIIELPDLSSLKETFYTNRCELASDSEVFINDFIKSITTQNPSQILPEAITYIPVKAYTASNSPQLNTTFRMILNALKLASSADITALNLDTFAATKSLSIQNLLGINPKPWTIIGLHPEWAKTYIINSGNYLQMLNRNIGKDSKLEIDNPQNKLIENGGMLVSQPFI